MFDDDMSCPDAVDKFGKKNMLVRDDFKKTGLFSDIDQISFYTHPPPPKDDILQKWLSVGKFTTHPPWRNNDIFLKKGVFDKIYRQLNFNDISAMKPSLI